MTQPMTQAMTQLMTQPITVLVLAKAPVPGVVKTRLGAEIGDLAAAELAAAALMDTIDAASKAGRGHLALAGDLADAVHGEELLAMLGEWTVTEQRGDSFAERLVTAHADAGAGLVVQIGMDTPQCSSADLIAAASALGDHDAALGPAEDGGWWVLARRDPAAAAPVAGVPMSTPTTCADTRAALERAGLRVATTGAMRDVDTVQDAAAVAQLAPHTRFARRWLELTDHPPGHSTQERSVPR